MSDTASSSNTDSDSEYDDSEDDLANIPSPPPGLPPGISKKRNVSPPPTAPVLSSPEAPPGIGNSVEPPAPPSIAPLKVVAPNASRVIDDSVTQQLRGLFAAHDTDHDHRITRKQLVEVLNMMGLRTSDELIEKFMPGSRKGNSHASIDLTSFLEVAAAELENASDVSSDLIELFEIFDPEDATGKRSGVLSVKTLRHIMLEVLTPDRLSMAEFDEFIVYAGLKTNGYAMEDHVKVNYHNLVNNLLIGKPKVNMRVE